jgi:hypothetical protein
MGVQERAKRKKEVYAFGMLKANEETIKDQAKLIKELRETILAYSERVNNYELQVGDLWKTIHEQLLIKDEQENTIEMYKIKVNRLRRTIGEYIDKYGLQ